MEEPVRDVRGSVDLQGGVVVVGGGQVLVEQGGFAVHIKRETVGGW